MDHDGLADGRSIPTRIERSPMRWFQLFDASVVRPWRERALVRRTSREALRLYRVIEATRPDLTGVTRYWEVVARQTGLDDYCARRLVARAESSFASWPVDRPLRFRDVVQYVAAVQCLDADPRARGIRTHLTAIVAAEIPQEL